MASPGYQASLLSCSAHKKTRLGACRIHVVGAEEASKYKRHCNFQQILSPSRNNRQNGSPWSHVWPIIKMSLITLFEPTGKTTNHDVIHEGSYIIIQSLAIGLLDKKLLKTANIRTGQENTLKANLDYDTKSIDAFRQFRRKRYPRNDKFHSLEGVA